MWQIWHLGSFHIYEICDPRESKIIVPTEKIINIYFFSIHYKIYLWHCVGQAWYLGIFHIYKIYNAREAKNTVPVGNIIIFFFRCIKGFAHIVLCGRHGTLSYSF